MTELDKKLGELYEARTGALPMYAVIAVSYIERIMTGEIKSGWPLPAVTKLAEDYAVNRRVVERALHLMEEHGFAEPCPRQPWRAILPAAALIGELVSIRKNVIPRIAEVERILINEGMMRSS